MRFSKETHRRTSLAVEATIEASSSLEIKRLKNENTQLSHHIMFTHLELSIAGTSVPYHRASGSTPVQILLSLFVNQYRETGPDGVNVERNGSIMSTSHKVSTNGVRRGEAEQVR